MFEFYLKTTEITLYKIFAKPQFLGKKVIFLPQCHSTNQEARTLALSGGLKHGTLIWTDYQESGKGQQGNIWVSEKEKNLLITLYLSSLIIKPSDHYLLNLVSSLAIRDILSKALPSSTVEVKWPNDVYADDNKIAGILIETVISGGVLEHAFCGMGINVNQSYFGLSTATSLFMRSGRSFDRDEVAENTLVSFEKYYSLMVNQPSLLIQEYLGQLRWIGEIHTYKIAGSESEGVITSIDNHGKLVLRIGNKSASFDVKEVEFLH